MRPPYGALAQQPGRLLGYTKRNGVKETGPLQRGLAGGALTAQADSLEDEGTGERDVRQAIPACGMHRRVTPAFAPSQSRRQGGDGSERRAAHHTSAAHWITQQTMVPMSVPTLSAITSVRIIMVT